jgi:molybdopterin/thiamine biosynthesis adenylyltransferase
MVFKQLCEHNLLKNASIVASNPCSKNRQSVYSFEGELSVENQSVKLLVGLDRFFPLSLPNIFLKSFDALGFIPHIDKDGFVCYAQKEGLLIDRNNPVGIIRDALFRARKTLLDGVLQNNSLDFLDEFEAYWRQLDNIQYIQSFIELGSKPQRIIAKKSKNKYVAITHNDATLRAYDKSIGQLTSYKAIYLPLKSDSAVFPPPFKTLWTLAEIRNIVCSNLSTESKYFLEGYITEKVKNDEIVILSQISPNGGIAIFGLLFKGVKLAHPLNAGSQVTEIMPLSLFRRDKAYLLPRGGSQIGLNHKKVALIGCGSVGGFMSQELIRAGVQNLTLIDKDTLKPENTFRHVLGHSYPSNKKVLALKDDIEKKMPYISITAKDKTIEELIAANEFHFNEFDLIIVALGVPTIELYLNQLCHITKNAPPILFTWLEPYGIGGHALVTNNGGYSGCLECLYVSDTPDKEKTLFNKASFAEKGQTFAKTLTGCGSLFTPYSALDSSQTAILATRLALFVLNGEEPDNPLLSWKGNNKHFLEAGFKLSIRYSQTETELFEKRYNYKHENCPICCGKG